MRLLRALAAALAIAAVAGCDDFPKDAERTMDEVAARGAVRAGIVGDRSAEARERALARAIARAAGVRADMEDGSAETLLRRLEEGDLDLVVGEFAKATPWKSRVTFTAAAQAEEPPAEQPVLRAAVRSGENGWLLFVTRALDGER